MPLSASAFLAQRYLRPKRSFISIITLISVLGVMLGVGVLIVVNSVFQGWQIEYKKLLLGFESHLIAVQEPDLDLPPQEAAALPKRTDWRELQKSLGARSGVISATPIAEGWTALRFGESSPQQAFVIGLKDGPENALLKKLSKHLVSGRFELKSDQIILTDKAAQTLGAKVGDVIAVLASDTIRQMIRDLRAAEQSEDAAQVQSKKEDITIVPKELTVTAIIRADTATDRCYVPLFVAQELFNLGGGISGIELEVQDPDAANALAENWMQSENWPHEWNLHTWTDRHGWMLQNVENQKSLVWFLLVFIVLVAAFCVMNTTITVTVQKRREIGILKALGAKASQIIGIFLSQAGVVAFVGTFSGLAIGFAVLHFRNDLRQWIAEKTGRDFFPQDIYFLSEIPAHVTSLDVVTIGLLALSLCLIAAFIPAWFAARVDPAVALRE